MKKPRLGEASLGALVGAMFGAFGGLFAIAIPWAILSHDIRALAMARTFGMIGFLTCAPIGWFTGGQIGPRLEAKLGARAAGILGGILGGLIPLSGFIFWGWHLVSSK